MTRPGRLYSGIALLSAATLAFELLLTRLFAVAEWYHFAFLSVSIALLGYACSGTLLALLTPSVRASLPAILSLAFPLSVAGAYAVINTVPFDSYQLAWDARQILYLGIYYLGLILPFGSAGLLIAHELAQYSERANALYAANLIGSAVGSLSLLVMLPALGGEGTALATAGVGAVGGALILSSARRRSLAWPSFAIWATLGLAVVCLLLATLRPAWMALRLSPYKSLSYALQTGDARLGYHRWSISARVDVVESQRIHSAPGLSLQYRGKLPPQHGLMVDGSNLSPITRRSSAEDTAFLSYLPVSIPYRLRPGATVLVLQPRGGLDVAAALHLGARRVVVVEDNALVVQAVRDVYDAWTGGLYRDPRVVLNVQDGRSALQRGIERFGIVIFSLSESYYPVSSGSYSLTENHLYTREAVAHALRRTSEGGLLVITRWLQDPPSEALRAGALIVEALESLGSAQPAAHLIAFRSWSTLTLLASPTPFTQADVGLVRTLCDELGYDLVYYLGMPREEANRRNLVAQPVDYDALQGLLMASERRAFYQTQFYDVTPPSDDRPFFGHYFRWRHIPHILKQLGKTWQPFGGSGFLLVLALLGIATLASGGLVLLPLLGLRSGLRHKPHLARTVIYFTALGLGFLMVELPLMQHFILYLGQPALAFIVVLSALLCASGVGSMMVPRVGLRWGLIALSLAILAYPLLLDHLFTATLNQALAYRALIAVVSLFPLGILLGLPFAGGIRRIEARVPGLIPWIWAINGSASVVSAVLAAVIALSAGYRLVLALAALCYLVATLAFWPFLTSPKETQS